MAFSDYIWNKSNSKDQKPDPAKAPMPVNMSDLPASHPYAASPAAATIVIPPRQDDAMYNKLKENVDIWKLPVFKQIASYAEPMKATLTDANIRFTTAFALAKSNLGVTRDKVLQALSQMDQVLEHEKQAFDQFVEETTQRDVIAKQAEIDGMSAKIKDLQSQIITLSGEQSKKQQEVAAKKVQLEDARTRFAQAYATRTNEVHSESQMYENLIASL